jgi:Protein of unknown function (DUF2442)
MGILANQADERVKNVRIEDEMLSVDLIDGRIISVPLSWYPRLFHATKEQLSIWEVAGGGYGIHWPELDEDLRTEGLLRGHLPQKHFPNLFD